MPSRSSDPRPVLVTGFGPFGAVANNPSGSMARWIDGRRVAGRPVVGRELRVALGALPSELARHVADADPVALVALGVQRGAWWRFERRARRPLTSPKADVDGVVAAHFDREARTFERATGLDVSALATDLAALGFDARASEDAGGFVCEWCYHHLLEHGARLGAPALFLHVPPDGAVPVEQRHLALEHVLTAIVRQLEPPARTD